MSVTNASRSGGTAATLPYLPEPLDVVVGILTDSTPRQAVRCCPRCDGPMRPRDTGVCTECRRDELPWGVFA